MWEVELDQVVAQQEAGPLREIVQLRQYLRQVSADKDQPLAGIRSHCGKLVDAAVFPPDLKVQREARRRMKAFVHAVKGHADIWSRPLRKD